MPDHKRSEVPLLPLLTALLLAAAVIHITGLAHQLPYHLNADEPNIWLYAQSMRTGEQYTRIAGWYPPLRVADLALHFTLLDAISWADVTQPQQFFFGRVSTVAYMLMLVALAFKAGAFLHSRAAGVAAMIFVALQPNAVELAKIFKVETFAWLLVMTCLALSYAAVRRDDRRLLGAAVAAGLGAALTKYHMAAALMVPGLLLALWGVKGRGLRWAVIIGGAAIIGLGLAVLANPPAQLEAWLVQFHVRQLYNRGQVFQFVSAGREWPELLQEIGPVNFWLALIGLPAGLALYKARPGMPFWLLIGATLAMMIGGYLFAGLFETNRTQDRYFVILGFGLVWAAGIAVLTRGRPWLAALAALLVSGPWMAQALRHNAGLNVPDTRIETAEWFQANVPSGTHFAMEKDFAEFSSYGGFPGTQTYFIQEIDSVYERPLEDYARAGIDYLVADYRNINRGGFFDESLPRQPFLSQVETVLDYGSPWEQGMGGPARYVFRVPPLMQHPMHVFMGQVIIFRGYDLPSRELAPGETLELVLYWGSQAETHANYIVFAHLIGPDGQLAAQRDGLPNDGLRPTFAWNAGYFDWDEWPISLPAELAPGTYTLIVGMYDADTQQRLPATAADGTPLGDHIPLGSLNIR